MKTSPAFRSTGAAQIGETLMAGLAGLVLGLGLLVSGMANPAKVLAFLDVAGAWNPSLALVMVGAIAVTVVAYAWARRAPRSWLGLVRQWPQAQGVDGRLILGSLLFGIGWGLAGFCPGPALVALGAGWWQGALFVLAMLVGMALWQLFISKRKEQG